METNQQSNGPADSDTRENRLAAARQQLMQHVTRYRLSTLEIVRHAIFNGDSQREAHAVVNRLVQAQRLFRHRLGSASYFSREKQSFSPNDAERAYRIACFCCLNARRQQLLAPGRLRKLELPVVASYLEDGQRLMWIKSGTEHPGRGYADLQQVLSMIQQWVEDEAFRGLSHFAAKDRFGIAFLMAHARQAAELGRWLDRRPVLSPLQQPPVRIPVAVHVVPSLLGP